MVGTLFSYSYYKKKKKNYWSVSSCVLILAIFFISQNKDMICLRKHEKRKLIYKIFLNCKLCMDGWEEH